MSDYLDSNRGANPPLADLSFATASIGTGANGTVVVVAEGALAGEAGNSFEIEVTEPAGTSSLTIVVAGTTITVELDVAAGVAGAPNNTATLIAAAIDAETDFSAVATGTGADSITAPEGPFAFSGGATIGASHHGPQSLAGTGTTETHNARAFTKDRMHILSVGDEPIRVLFASAPALSTVVPPTGGAIIPAGAQFTFRAIAKAAHVYVEAADGSSAYEASVWQRER